MDGESTPAEQPGAQIRPATDIQAILTVLECRDETARKQNEAASPLLDLVVRDLRGVALVDAHLEGANHAKEDQLTGEAL